MCPDQLPTPYSLSRPGLASWVCNCKVRALLSEVLPHLPECPAVTILSLNSVWPRGPTFSFYAEPHKLLPCSASEPLIPRFSGTCNRSRVSIKQGAGQPQSPSKQGTLSLAPTVLQPLPKGAFNSLTLLRISSPLAQDCVHFTELWNY